MDYCSIGDKVVKTKHILEEDLNTLKHIANGLSNSDTEVFGEYLELKTLIDSVENDYLDVPSTDIIRDKLSKLELQTLILRKVKEIYPLLGDDLSDKDACKRFKLMYELIRLCNDIR